MNTWNTEQVKGLKQLSSFNITELYPGIDAIRIANIFKYCVYESPMDVTMLDLLIFLNHNNSCIGVYETRFHYLADLPTLNHEVQKIVSIVMDNEPYKIIGLSANLGDDIKPGSSDMNFVSALKKELTKHKVELVDWIKYDMKENWYSFFDEMKLGEL